MPAAVERRKLYPARGRVPRGLAKKKPPHCGGSELLAERTGLEPATPGVTGRYSNQLNYRSNVASPRGFEPLLQP
jgi:hypothetical protein